MNRDENDEDDACNDNDNIIILFYWRENWQISSIDKSFVIIWIGKLIHRSDSHLTINMKYIYNLLLAIIEIALIQMSIRQYWSTNLLYQRKL